MYGSLNIDSLGITGRQSELIELALTHLFKGLDLDLETFSRQVEERGQEHAARFINSAEIRIGTWQLPVRWQEDEETFKEDLQKLSTIASVASTIGANRCITDVMSGSDSLPLQENFEFHRARFTDVAERLAPHGISLGLGFQAAAASRVGLAHQFVVEADGLIALMKSVSADNVGLYLDTWNWHLGGGTADQLAELTADDVVAVCVADIPSAATAATIELSQRLLPSPTGVVPVAEILLKLREMEYLGPVIPRPDVSQFTGVTRDVIVQQTADALHSVWPGGDVTEEDEEAAVGDDIVDSESTGKTNEQPAVTS